MQALYGPTGHLSSPSMTKFLSIIPAFSTTGLDLSHYRLVAGFLDLPSSNLPPSIVNSTSSAAALTELILDIRITSTSPSTRPALLSSLTTLVNSVEMQERFRRADGKASGTLTYTAFASLDDETGVRIFGRWKTREDMEAFVRRDDVLGFWMKIKEVVKGMEQRMYVGNGKGWLHRGVGSGFPGENEGGNLN
jgi:quinol monooxygenase YgiN